jgi:lysophospholipase L1-like esterase
LTIKGILAVMVLALLSGCQGPAQYTGPALFIGDSITANWHVERIIPGAIKLGVPGASIHQLYDKAVPQIQTVRPGLVHILAGTNDHLLAGKFSAVSKVLKLAFAARKAGASVVIIGTIPPEDHGIYKDNSFFDVSRYNSILLISARVCGFRVADYNTAMATHAGLPKPGLLSDGVHPNDVGYEVMKQVLLETMK